MPLQWNPAWDIGIDIIDSQHRRWLEIFNALERSFLQGESMYDMQLSTFKEMLDYTHLHFDNEEKLMADSGYPAFSSHRRLHRDFDTLIYRHFRSHESSEAMLTSEMLQMMRNWLIAHIQSEDQKIAAFLASEGKAGSQ